MAVAVLGATAGRILVVIHAILGTSVVAFSTHLAVWSFGAYRGRATSQRRLRWSAGAACVAYAAELVLGVAMYPTYKVHVRAEVLDAAGGAHTWAARLFEWKEHWIALGLPLLVVAFVLAGMRRPATARVAWPAALFYCAAGAALCAWAGAVFGLTVTSVRSIGAI
jgi:hypothetical protein